ncbi:hypothetical protein WJX82_005404 [Trebouxia sp. C0006]
MSTVELKRRKSKRLQSKGLQSTDASHTRPNVNSNKANAGSTKMNGSHDQPRPRQGSILWCCSMALVLLAALAVGTSKLGVLDRQSAVNLPSATNESPASQSLNHTDPRPEAESINNIQGIFPKGCQWRDIQHEGQAKKFWAKEEYEYWHGDVKQWKPEMPQTCAVRGAPAKQGYAWLNGTPRTEVECAATHCIYRNLWYNNGRFYLLVDGPAAVAPWKMTRNQDLNVVHVDDANQWAAPLDAKVVSGDTLIFDFVYFLHPTAIGHWSEMMFPLFSILRLEPAFKRPATQFMLLHLKRVHLMEWARAVMSVALGVKVHEDLPPMLMQQESDSVWTQIPSPLEGYEPHEWVSFERALVVRDIFTGGVRTFLSTQDAQAFRASMYKQYYLPFPESGRPVPRVITFQRKRANRRVINEDQLVRMLREFAEVRVVEFNTSTSFHEQLQVISGTGVFISVHTSNLANAQFLPPGAAVFEIIQRNWVWENLDRSFQIQTEMMGDIHHYAWRARHRNQTVYINKRDSERFGDWTSQQCATEDCVEAHTNVDVVVNVNEFRALLKDRLPHVWAGKSVAEAAIPWPEV